MSLLGAQYCLRLRHACVPQRVSAEPPVQCGELVWYTVNDLVIAGQPCPPPPNHQPLNIVLNSSPFSSTLFRCAAVAKSGIYTYDVVMLSALFDANNPTASLASSILRAVNRQLASKAAGNTVAFLNSTPPVLIRIVPPAPGKSINDSRDSGLVSYY
ncbi:hypothetical protein EDD18DRAFT_1109611 [Armillaria luteobubalina]|uniref:Uncharacterized protein n=1 Tax=Armillaria luteobubalina TaxID=153913 RepID=A0AA39UJB2_9AGAR|nr:hypothetical protein EDD18DRAFT_1109611 [Armillaria luteobubalina]